MNRVAVLVDTPNIFWTVAARYGAEARADYWTLREWAKTLGDVQYLEAFTNPGVPPLFVSSLTRVGYDIKTPQKALDIDEAMIARAVELHDKIDQLVIASGDGHFTEVVELLRAVGVTTVVAAVRASTSRVLIEAAAGFVEFPVRLPVLATV